MAQKKAKSGVPAMHGCEGQFQYSAYDCSGRHCTKTGACANSAAMKRSATAAGGGGAGHSSSGGSCRGRSIGRLTTGA